MRVVIDTNILLRSISRNSPERIIYHAFDTNKFIWVFSNEIVSEYAEIIASYYNERTMNAVLSILLESDNIEIFEPTYKWQLVAQDPDDNKFVDCALGANVDYLVTDDKHIKNLLKIPDLFPPVPVIGFKEFKKMLDK